MRRGPRKTWIKPTDVEYLIERAAWSMDGVSWDTGFASGMLHAIWLLALDQYQLPGITVWTQGMKAAYAIGKFAKGG